MRFPAVCDRPREGTKCSSPSKRSHTCAPKLSEPTPSAHKLLHCWQLGAVQMQIFAKYGYAMTQLNHAPRKIHALGADARLRMSRCQSKNPKKKPKKSCFASRLTACSAIQIEITYRIASDGFST